MLVNLHVKNLAIIDEIDICFENHLNVLTGETGAGKSIILGSINIALGGKVNRDIIRKGAEYALVELVFQIDDLHTMEQLKELEIYPEDSQLIISRKITNQRITNRINGENVSNATLKQVAELLIDIHGQHEHQSLLYKSKHLSIIDQYAKQVTSPLKQEISGIYREYQRINKELEETAISEDQKLREISFLEYEINEIESAKLKSGEDAELAAEYKRLSNANTISENLSSMYEISSEGNDSISDNVSRCIRMLSRIVEFDKSLENYLQQLIDIDNLMNDFNREMQDYMSDLNFDSQEFMQIEDRLNLINNLKAKYGNTIEDVLIYLSNTKNKLDKYIAYDEYQERLKEDKERLENKLNSLSTELSNHRSEYAKELEGKIIEALKELNFDNVQFSISIKQMDRYTESGFDDVEFLISTNLGEDLKPLSKVASGGELSRIMLAIKSVLADQDFVNTLIFDEIDVGISGRTAQKVSERMTVISSKHQVLCITHLPQIAAMADYHYIIEKKEDNIRTTTTIRMLSEEESVEELARMLGGAMITDNVRNNAKEMKELADETKCY